MIVGIGIDLCCISRIRRIVEQGPGHATRFARRILHPTEWTDYQRRWVIRSQRPVPDDMVWFLASRWAVKEAAYKALYPQRKLTWKEVALVKSTGSPKPYLKIERAQECDGAGHSHVSLSHDGDWVVAQVIFEN
ncbi:4'-phosphopantetheinyl transferase superfamily [Dimargaris cristalligena]|uniref:4'-phosphopantetheinyl transferase superfamily n=1 Tax=Dimargaris cristalligena TaxID=215637 RepID=A0A4P9ZM35_9FUNG|nr:4'-phosphopantetheinyl transferase superfamily [Dimargaris cristalligena]|eukprot:RKP34233.1 4'-phosphopantetheinyl transferase superfamily [Dimargaris cristalligena]